MLCNLFKSIFSVSLIASLVACANNPIRNYKAETDKPLMLSGGNQLSGAISTFKGNSDLLSSFELGSLYRMQQNYLESNLNFNNATGAVNKWLASYHNGTWGAISDTLEAGLVNDKTLDYQVKDYEKVMLSTYIALNHVSLNNLDNARVEIKRMYQIEDRIRQYREAMYQQQQRRTKNLPSKAPTLEQVEKKNASVYNFDFINKPSVLELQNSYESAFSHYVAGFVFEALGEYDLARPGYLRAKQLNPTNSLIKSSIANIDNNNFIHNNQQTEVLFIEEVGHAPQLKSMTLPIPWVQNSNNNNCFMAATVSLPMLVPDKSNSTLSRFLVDNSQQYVPVLLTDINLMAARALHDNLPNIFMRNILRVARDYGLQQMACNNGVDLIGVASLLGGSIINAADERVWVMLPSKIYAERLRLNRGVHKLQIITSGGMVSATINLTKPYQIISWRVIGNNVYFSQ